jgi:hypothetical protein
MSAPTVTSIPGDVDSLEIRTGPDTLAGEHERLLRDVRRRAEPVLALVAARAWPEAELRTLTNFLRSVVLRQASDEEVALFPGGAAAPFAELSAEHARLHELTAELDRADPKSCPLPDLGRLVDRLVRVLERHLAQERALLAALPDVPDVVPAAAEVVAGTQTWPVCEGAPVLVLLDTLPQEQAVQLCLERLLRLRPGQSAEVHSGREADLQRICRWLKGFDSSRYGFARLPAGDVCAALQVTRR